MVSQVVEPGAIRRTRAIKDALTYLTLAITGLIAAGPIVYLVATSLKQTYTRTVDLSVLWNPSLVNYYNVWFVHPFRQWMINSLIVAAIVTVSILFLDSLAGYAFAKKRFRGREAFFLVLLSTLMVPLPVTLLPTFLLANRLGLIDTYQALILPGLAYPVGVFMMRQFIESLPSDLENAARLDGCSEFQIFRRVILPLMKPGLVVLGVFTFMTQWTSYLWPLVISTREDMLTLTVGVQSLRSLFTVNWGVLSAGAVLSLLPLILVFLFLQRYFIAGSIAGALKE